MGAGIPGFDRDDHPFVPTGGCSEGRAQARQGSPGATAEGGAKRLDGASTAPRRTRSGRSGSCGRSLTLLIPAYWPTRTAQDSTKGYCRNGTHRAIAPVRSSADPWASAGCQDGSGDRAGSLERRSTGVGCQGGSGDRAGSLGRRSTGVGCQGGSGDRAGSLERRSTGVGCQGGSGDLAGWLERRSRACIMLPALSGDAAMGLDPADWLRPNLRWARAPMRPNPRTACCPWPRGEADDEALCVASAPAVID
jgi:hypothetical protein